MTWLKHLSCFLSQCLIPLAVVRARWFQRRDVEAQPAGLVWEPDGLRAGHSPEDRPAGSEETASGSAFTPERLQCGEYGFNKSIYFSKVLVLRAVVKLQRFTVNPADRSISNRKSSCKFEVLVSFP